MKESRHSVKDEAAKPKENEDVDMTKEEQAAGEEA